MVVRVRRQMKWSINIVDLDLNIIYKRRELQLTAKRTKYFSLSYRAEPYFMMSYLKIKTILKVKKDQQHQFTIISNRLSSLFAYAPTSRHQFKAVINKSSYQ